MLNFVVKFKTITTKEKVTMTQAQILADDQLARHAQSIITGFDSGVVGITCDTESYGKVSIEVEGFEA